MIQENLSGLNKNNIERPFTIYEITLINRLGEDCGKVAYVRLGEYVEDRLNREIYELIKTRYPLSRNIHHSHFTSQKVEDFQTYRSYDSLLLFGKNSTKFDPGYEDPNVDSYLIVNLEVYEANEHYIFNSLDAILRIPSEELLHANREANSNLATYREFMQ